MVREGRKERKRRKGKKDRKELKREEGRREKEGERVRSLAEKASQRKPRRESLAEKR